MIKTFIYKHAITNTLKATILAHEAHQVQTWFLLTLKPSLIM